MHKRHLLDKEGKQLTNYTKIVQAIRIRSIAIGNFSKTKSISSSVVSLPREKRIKDDASFLDLPRAERTWEGLREPEEQAEPEEAQIPSKSRAASKVMLSISGTVNEQVLD